MFHSLIRIKEDGSGRTTSQLFTHVVTHEMNFARDVADRVVFFDEGEIVEERTPVEVLGAPRKERTKRFLNMLSGGVDSLEEG